jgi:hypothetical protein
MTTDEFCRRIADIESHANRTSFGCSRECPHDFYWHGDALIRFLTTFVEAEFYEEENPEFEYPDCPCSLRPRFDSDAAVFLERWKRCAA